MERLDAARIDLPGIEVQVLASCASTNSLLLDWQGGLPVLLATEAQTAGRGRRGRRWHSAPGADVAFSLAVRIRRPARELATLSLVAGVAAAAALRRLGVAHAMLKWPNDLMVDAAKLGGILVETRSDGDSGTRAVFGIGINCRRDPRLAARLGRPLAALDELIAPSRNLVIREVARSLLAALERFERDGFAALRPQWERMHAHAGQRLRVRLAGGRSLSGIAAGLAGDGGLKLRNRRGEHVVRSGRIVSARAA
jgi:BirA family transcriptional regulator, biotin operon repressor / biotin---[acetyl-CoA-carboxylase] ligase